MDPIVDAISEVIKSSQKNDQMLLDLIKEVIEKLNSMVIRIENLEFVVTHSSSKSMERKD